MNYKIDHIPKSNHKRPGTKMAPTTITIHGTENPKSTAKNERDNLAREGNTRAASFHIAVDDKEAIECIPLNEITYHAGVREGNNTSISIEMCESGDRAKTIQNTIELVAKMLHERKWGTGKLRRHFDWSGKICPKIMSANNWADWNTFKANIQKELDKLNKPVEKLHWGEVPYSNLIKKGIILDEKRFDDNITRAESMALMDKATDKIIEMIKGVK